MEYSCGTTTNTAVAAAANGHYKSSSSSSPSSSPSNYLPPKPPVLSPCAACKMLRRRCVDKCVLAPYFPPTDPRKFTTAHRVFGASNIIKFLQELPESQRADAVSSMVYEANARIRDPVYGCAGAICQLQKQVAELQVQLARAQADLVNSRAQHANLLAVIYMQFDVSQYSQLQQQQQFAPPPTDDLSGFFQNDALLLDFDGSFWEEPLWT